ncbi:uncharacterized protein LOC132401290 [Hypanus sabinus]|uniref:uncharacterized protein LOC132401290 n=1 Tax=Hypanus sabinus TaxID=79690 RepID=UPI0028C4C142|nr:uncharacterized protein LOC132401290 [Hypanus sabinus]
MIPAELRVLLLILGSLVADLATGDPCGNHTILDQPWRSTDCSKTRCSGRWMDDGHLTEGWYRFSRHGNVKIPETTVPFFHCSAWVPGWLKGLHPDVGAGEVNRIICFNWVDQTCKKQLEIRIKNCTAYYVYKLKPTPDSYRVYCTVTDPALGDPCINYNILDQPWRSTNSPSTSGQCSSDTSLEQGWYRFSSSGDWRIPEEELPVGVCCGKSPGWLGGSHPTVTEGEVMRKVCFMMNGNIIPGSGMSTTGAIQSNTTCLDIKVKNCIGYFVYLLKPTPSDHAVYCTDSTLGDPCVNHTILDQPWRSTDCSLEECSKYMNDDARTEGWYRFKSSGGWRIPETAVATEKCSGTSPGWLNGHHPSTGEGEVNRTVCFSWKSNSCETKRIIKVKNCGAFFVYWLKPTLCCNKVYCTDPASEPTPQPEGTTPESGDDLSTITDPDTSSDLEISTNGCPKGTVTSENVQEPSLNPTRETSSDIKKSTSEEAGDSSTREHTQEPSSVPAGDAPKVKRLPTKEECEKMINTVQVLYVGQNSQGSSEDYLRLVRKMLREQTLCKYVLSK